MNSGGAPEECYMDWAALMVQPFSMTDTADLLHQYFEREERDHGRHGCDAVAPIAASIFQMTKVC